MDTSLRLPAADPSALQSARPIVRQLGIDALREPAAPETGVAAQVSISEQGRAAEQAARLDVPAPPVVPAAGAPAATVVAPVDTAAVAATGSAFATLGPASEPARVQLTQGSAETRGASRAQAQAEQRPDAATAAARPSVQLYLENSSLPAAQAGPSAVRISA